MHLPAVIYSSSFYLVTNEDNHRASYCTDIVIASKNSFFLKRYASGMRRLYLIKIIVVNREILLAGSVLASTTHLSAHS